MLPAEASVRLGALQREIGNEAYFEELYASYPDDAQANVLLAVSRLRNGKPAEAEKLLADFLGKNSRVPEAWKVLVKVRLKLRDYEGARRAYGKLEALGGKPFPEDKIALDIHGGKRR